MTPPLPGSWNNLQDRYDEELNNEEQESHELECGCLKGNCTCDAGWDERDDN